VDAAEIAAPDSHSNSLFKFKFNIPLYLCAFFIA